MSTPTERLNQFVEVAFGGKVAAFAAALGWKPQATYKYLRGTRPVGRAFLFEIERIGGNAAWIRGETDGPMFADNEAGRRLREEKGTPKIEPSVSHTTARETPAVAEKAHGYLIDSYHITTREMLETLLGYDDEDAARNPQDQPRETRETRETIPLIPLFLMPVSAGYPTYADDHVDRWINPITYLAPHPETTFMVSVSGESMCYDDIRTGDVLIADRAILPANNHVVVAVLNGEALVKRLRIDDSGTFLLPANPCYEGIRVTENDKFRIWGVVTKVVHDVV